MTEEKNQNAIKKVIEKYSKEAGISIHQLRGYLTDPRFIGILYIYKQEIIAKINRKVDDLRQEFIDNDYFAGDRALEQVIKILDEVGK